MKNFSKSSDTLDHLRTREQQLDAETVIDLQDYFFSHNIEFSPIGGGGGTLFYSTYLFDDKFSIGIHIPYSGRTYPTDIVINDDYDNKTQATSIGECIKKIEELIDKHSPKRTV